MALLVQMGHLKFRGEFLLLKTNYLLVKCHFKSCYITNRQKVRMIQYKEYGIGIVLILHCPN